MRRHFQPIFLPAAKVPAKVSAQAPDAEVLPENKTKRRSA